MTRAMPRNTGAGAEESLGSSGSSGSSASSSGSGSPNDPIIVTVPFTYTYFVKPEGTVFEALVESDWRTKQTKMVNATNPAGIEDQILKPLPDSAMLFDNLAALRNVVDAVNEEYAQYGVIAILNEFRVADLKLTASIIGTYGTQQQIYDIRLKLIGAYSPVSEEKVQLDAARNPQCFVAGRLAPHFQDYLKEVSTYTGASVYVTESDICIVGRRHQVKACKKRLRLKMDDMNPQTYSEYLELSSVSLLPLVAGPDLINMKRIIRQTHCNIYLPDLLPNLYCGGKSSAAAADARIYITGVRGLVLEAKAAIAEIVSRIAKTPFIKQVAVTPLKREMLILEPVAAASGAAGKSDLPEAGTPVFDNLMYTTGCFISIPPLGSRGDERTGDVVTVQGNSMEEVEAAVDQFVALLTQQYSAKSEFVCENAQEVVDINKFLNLCDTLGSNSTVAVSAARCGRSYIVQTLGGPQSTRVATNYLSQLGSYLKETIGHTQVQFQIELPNKEQDFISGKKNGKLVKISNAAGVSLEVLPFTDQNVVVDLVADTLRAAMLGLDLLEEELPTSLTFNVPESFHRQIIGVGGQTVQTIMRKYNVFIKFTNSFEMGDRPLDKQHAGQTANFGQGFLRKRNVIIKCPAKNKAQIPLVRLELERLVDQVTRCSYVCSSLSFSPTQWLLLTSVEFNEQFNTGKKKPTNLITELEKHTNTFIDFPGPEVDLSRAPSVAVRVYGPENSPRIACGELHKMLPYCYELRLKKSLTFGELQTVALGTVGGDLMDGAHTLDAVQENYLNSVVVPLRMMFNAEIELAAHADAPYDSLAIHYFPTAFGQSFASLKTERLSVDAQNKLVQSANFQKMLQTVHAFLEDGKLEVLAEQTKTVDLEVQSSGPHGTEKENIARANDYSKFHRRQRSAVTRRFANQENLVPLAAAYAQQQRPGERHLRHQSMPPQAFGSYAYQPALQSQRPQSQQRLLGSHKNSQSATASPLFNSAGFEYTGYNNTHWH